MVCNNYVTYVAYQKFSWFHRRSPHLVYLTWYVHMPKLTHFGDHFLPIMAHFDLKIKPKLAETALLFCRVTNVCAMPANNGTTNQNWQKPSILNGAKSCLVCYMYTSHNVLWRASCMHSLIPRPSNTSCFISVFYSMQNTVSNQKLVV